jgi:negative regulator of flagellin synthesis FlgM
MQIHGTTHIHGPHGINPPHAPFRAPGAHEATGASPADRVDISAAAEEAIRASENGDIRQTLVNEIRTQIAAGTYETPAKLDAAVERLLDKIG